MTAPKPVSAVLSSLSRPSQLSPFICRPCQTQLQLQLRLQQRRSQQQNPCSQTRSLHQHVKASAIPKPTPFVPDVSTFLTLIGRKLSVHSSKFETWNDLFASSSPKLKELGVEPARSRRYLLRWREKFRRGEFGIGGDFKHVAEGEGELRIVEVPSLKSLESSSEDNSDKEKDGSVSISRTPGMTKMIVNVPKGAKTYVLDAGQTTRDLKKPKFVSLKDGHVIAGSHVLPVKGNNGSVATLKVVEGLWEDKRGRKIYGGERRRAETLHKMRVAERKKNER